MISHGDHHLQVPREPLENLRWRLRFLDAVARDGPVGRQAVRRMCEEDLLFFINAFVLQYNPDSLTRRIGPFCTWEFQDQALLAILKAIEDRKDLVIEKSRDMGASWMCLMVMDWLCRFHRDVEFLIISRDEKSVDSPAKASLLPKLDYLNRHVPDWLTEERVRRPNYIGYPRMESALTGEASTKVAGVGGRALAIFFDEFARFGAGKKNADAAALRATADVSACRIFNSTHAGVGTEFYRLTMRPDVRKLVLHWSQHPEKRIGLYLQNESLPGKVQRLDKSYSFPPDYPYVTDGRPHGGPFPGLRSAWYDAEDIRRSGKRGCAEDLDIDVSGATVQFFDAGLIHQLKTHDAQPPMWEGDLSYDRDTGRPNKHALLPRKGGALRLWCHPDLDGRLPPGRYTMGGDLSWGTGATPSCLSLFDAVTGSQVGEYVNAHITPKDLAPLAVALCWLAKDRDQQGALFAWEMIGPGSQFGLRVLELGYRRIYYRTDDKKDPPEKSDVPGWYPSSQTKGLLLGEFHAALADGSCQIRSDDCLTECLAYEHDGKGGAEHGRAKSTDDPSAARESHGDRPIAAALGWKMVRELGYAGARGREPEEQAPQANSLAGRMALAKLKERAVGMWS